jgi:predicted phage terminase large subunit-like protein
MTNLSSSSTAPAFSNLTEEEQVRLYRLTLEGDLGGYVRAAWPILEPATPFNENWHVDLIAEYLTLVRRREIKRLIINVPPRTGKSNLITVMFPTWVWTQEPHARFICSSYADSLSTKHSIDRRDIISSPWYQQLWGDRVTLADDQNLKTEYQNSARGVMVATSTGGGIVGKGADYIIIDDPHNPLQVLSDTERATALRHFDTALSTRLNDPQRGAIVLVMQRLHEGDLTGHLLAKQGWEHVCIPAQAERNEVWKFPVSGRRYERKIDEMLWPTRWSVEVLDRFKSDLGSYGYAGQFQQRPSPAEGGILKRGWWKRFDTPPEKFDQMIQSWDFTFKDSKGSDFVVGQVWGRVGSNKYLLDQIRAKLSFSGSLAAMRTMTLRWPAATAKIVEDKANGPAIIDALRNELTGIVPMFPQGSKLARAQAAAPELEAGNYWLPQTQWAEEMIEECAAFPNAAHDDMVDAWSQAACRFRTSSSGIFEYYREQAELVAAATQEDYYPEGLKREG